MDKILLAFSTLRDKISALILDTNAALVRLSRAIEKLKNNKAETTEITRLDGRVDATNTTVSNLSNNVNTLSTVVSNLGTETTQIKADLSSLQTVVASQGLTVTTVQEEVELVKEKANMLETSLADLLQKVLWSGTKEFSFESTSSDPLDFAILLGEKAAEVGASLVNQQYVLNVVGAGAFTYPDVNGDMTVVEVTNGGRIIMSYTDGLISNVIVVPTPEGGLVVPDIDVTTEPNTLDANTDSILSAYFD